jgi:DNA polymerase-3 subunit delta
MTPADASQQIGKNPAPVYLVMGDEPYFVRQVIAQFCDRIDPSARDFNSDVFVGAEVNVSRLIQLAQTFPVHSPHRLIVVKEADQIKNSATLVPYLEQPNPTTILVLVAAKPDMRTGLFIALKKTAKVMVCASLKENELTPWIARAGQQMGLRLSQEALWALKEQCGRNLLLLEQKLAILALSDANGGAVSGEMAQRVGGGQNRTVFELVDLVSEKNMRGALGCLRDLLGEGESPLGILALLLRQWRMMAIAKQGRDAGLSETAAGSVAGLPPFLMTAFFRRLSRWRPDEIRRAFDLARAADSELKGGATPPSFVLEAMILSLCNASGSGDPHHLGGHATDEAPGGSGLYSKRTL